MATEPGKQTLGDVAKPDYMVINLLTAGQAQEGSGGSEKWGAVS